MSKMIGVLTLSLMSIFFNACSDPGTSTEQQEDNSLGAAAVREYGSQVRAQQEAEKERQAQQQALAYKSAITTLLAQDYTISVSLYSSDKNRVAEEMRKLDMSQCPRDFAVAYLDHIYAWEDAGKIQRAERALHSDENIGNVLGQQLMQSIFSSDESALRDAAETETRLRAAAEAASSRIITTFHKVERIAVAYGATLPQK